MKDRYKTVCKKSFSKLDSQGNYYTFIKDREYEYEEFVNLDYFCVLIYCRHNKNVYCRIFKTEFKESFFTSSELRKEKLGKIYESNL